MTTGCGCGTPSAGTSHRAGRECAGCRIAAEPNPVMRALKRAAEAVLSGPAAGRNDHLPRRSEARADREAGS
jgi:hypothetical protein